MGIAGSGTHRRVFIQDSAHKSGKHFEKLREGAKESVAKPAGKHFCQIAIQYVEMRTCIERKQHANKYPIIKKECSGCPFFEDQ